MPTRSARFDDFLTLTRLYARFDAIAEGRARGDSTAAHQAVLDRLHENQSFAERLGWTGFALDRLGNSGRLVLWGITPAGTRDVVGDWIPGVRPGRDVTGPPDVEPAASARVAAPHLHTYEELKPVLRRFLPSASPVLDVGVFDRVATRIAAIEGKSGPASVRPSTVDVAGRGRPLVMHVDSSDQSRWFDDGGR